MLDPRSSFRTARLAALLLGAALFLRAGAATALETIYLANDDHTDYFWSGDDLQYRTAFLSMLDYYMDQAEATASNPPDQRGRFNCDGSLWVWEYEHNRSEADFDRLVSHLADGSITMPKNTLITLYGAMPAEAILRDMYYAGRLERRYGLAFPMVVPMENQVLQSGGLASLWAGSGVEYSWKGICDCATLINASDRPREIYRYQGPDGQGITLKWNSMLNGNQSIGGYAEARDPFGIVSFLESNAQYNARWPWTTHGAFGYGWDDLQSTTPLFVQAAQSLTNPNRRVVVSNEVDFFEDFLAQHSGEIPTFGGSHGNEWEILCGAMGELCADMKREVEKLRTAEALEAIVASYDPYALAGREVERDLAYQACGLFYEHDWAGDGPVSQAARIQFERDQRNRLKLYVDDLQADALLALGGLVRNTSGSERHLVFNPLSGSRSDYVDLAVTTPLPVHVVEAGSNTEVRSQPITIGGVPYVRILANAVPGVGFRQYEVRSGAGQSFPPSATVTLPSVDNGIYRVTLGSRGQITSVIDHKDGDREMVGSGGAIHDLGNGSGSVVIESQGPVTTTLKVVAGGTPAHQTRVTLIAGVDRIEVEGKITANFGNEVGYTSAFNLPGMTMRHEEEGAILQVGRVSQGGDYADQNARTDYLTMNHFVDLSTADRGVVLSNWDSSFFVAGNSTVSTLDSTTPKVRAMVGFRVNNFGIPNQGGDTSFLNRYALQTHGAYDPAVSMWFALQHQNPLVATRVTGGASAPINSLNYAYLQLAYPHQLLWSLKPSEEGIQAGLIARVWNLKASPSQLQMVANYFPVSGAKVTSHVETDLRPVQVLVGRSIYDSTLPFEMKTFRYERDQFVGVEPVAPSLGVTVHPNPVVAGAACSLRFRAPQTGFAKVVLYDAAGASHGDLFSGQLEAGPHTLELKVPSGLAAGVYFARFACGGTTGSAKLLVLAR